MRAVIVNGPIFDGERMLLDHAVVVYGGAVVEVCRAATVSPSLGRVHDLNGRLLAPGFIDLQVNGGGGVVFNNEPTVETLRTMSDAHRKYGTIGFLPTLISCDFETMRSAVDAVSAAMSAQVPGVLGIHFEGPHLNAKRAGAHNPAHIRDLDERALSVIGSLAFGKTVVTLAPETVLPGQIAHLAARGIIVCAGHSDADYETARRSVDWGVSGFTHLFNAMSQMSAREPGLVGAALHTRNTWFGVIADGHHVHPAAFEAAVRAKQTGGAILVTDAMATVGTGQTSFELNGDRIRLVNGRCVNSRGVLSGSALNMNDAVRNAARYTKMEFTEAIRMASLYPAQALGLATRYGRIRPGFVASFVELDECRTVTGTWSSGHYSPADGHVH